MIPPHLYEIQLQIEGHARGYGLDFFPQIFEILDYKTMNEVAAYGGFPTRYPHWRFGMEYEKLSKSYAYGLSKIYELVINNDPCYAYLLEGNSFVDQKLVMAHVYAHNDFFKNNYFFSKTNRKMIDEMANHATRIRRKMDRFGAERVESFIDVCYSLDNLIDPLSLFIERRPAVKKEEDQDKKPPSTKLKAKSYMDRYINPPPSNEGFLDREKEAGIQEQEEKLPKFPANPQKDVLRFLIEHAPLESWQQEIMEIIREEAYYFAPQGMTKIMNEGWATYWHSKIMTQKVLSDSEVIDYADHAAKVLGGGLSLNPYKIGIELFRHIEERWNKGRFGREWQECTNLEERQNWDRRMGLGKEKLFQVRAIFNDVMFIDEFFTEEFCREHLFFTYGWNERSAHWEIQSRQYQQIKQKLLGMLTHGGNPFVEVDDGNFENRGELLLTHHHEGIDLRQDWARDTLVNLYRVWRRPVHILTKIEDKEIILSYDGKGHGEKATGQGTNQG